jgi:uncharacterized phage protein (TIGR01671 family)
MREIKFRAWDAEEKNFICFDALDGILSKCDETYRQRCVCKFEQFTGLHDKNGKEIYEGDILRLNYDRTSGKPIEGMVRWFQGNRHPEDGCYGMEYLGWVLSEYKSMDPASESYHMSIESVREVIGNIHENPELLND